MSSDGIVEVCHDYLAAAGTLEVFSQTLGKLFSGVDFGFSRHTVGRLLLFIGSDWSTAWTVAYLIRCHDFDFFTTSSSNGSDCPLSNLIALCMSDPSDSIVTYHGQDSARFIRSFVVDFCCCCCEFVVFVILPGDIV